MGNYLLNKLYERNIWFLTLALQECILLFKFLDWLCHLESETKTLKIRRGFFLPKNLGKVSRATRVTKLHRNTIIEHDLRIKKQDGTTMRVGYQCFTFSISSLNVSKTSLLFNNASCKEVQTTIRYRTANRQNLIYWNWETINYQV